MTKVIVCCHKPIDRQFGNQYLPVHCGAALHKPIDGLQSDDFDGGISAKNPSYCELTGLYWAWKNLKDADVVGLCHYRRFFDFHRQARVPYQCFCPEDIGNKNLSIPADIEMAVAKGAIVAPAPIYLRYSVATDFCCHHNSADFRLLESVAGGVGDLAMDFHQAMHNSEKLYSCNMFIMNRLEFDRMCNYMFSILQEVEAMVDCSAYDAYQQRLMGFLGERLMNVWFFHRRDRLIETPVMVFSDADHYQGMSPLMYHLQHARILLGRKIMTTKS